MPYQIKNGKVYGSNAVSLTQAQYDALSTAEKNNGTVYYIYDSEAVLDASDVSLGSGTVEDLAGSVAVIETSPTTATHAVGSYIVYNGQLYEVTAAIAVGETLTVGTNISATTVGAELTSLNNGLTIKTLTPTAVGSGVTINSHSMVLYGKVLQFSIDVTLASQISTYGNIVSLGGKFAAAGWCHPIFSAAFVPSSEKTIYGDAGNQNIRSGQTLPAGRYRLIGMILVK